MSDFAEIAAKAQEETESTPEPTPAPETAAARAGDGAEEASAGADVSAVAPEEESTAQFEPVIQLEEVEVKTHEEDEEVLWKMRGKLFIFGETLLNKGTGQKEWVERGIGEIKFLQHTENRMVRVLMRQEKTMKVICNHVTDPRIVLKPNAGSDRSWVWNAYDFAEGQLEETTFALRFGNSDSSNEFKEQFTSAQKTVEGIMAGEVQEPAATTETKAPAAEETPEADAAADALASLSVGAEGSTPPTEKA